jgi:hypothetical protein
MAVGDSIDIAGDLHEIFVLSEGPETIERRQEGNARRDVESA